ncbi:MAG: glycosyltransferase family A protein, partial [Pseudoflavonifractor sp.]
MITVFTPTYNRADLLPELYASLCRQTCPDFEWLIVDDGSADGTGALCAGWAAAERRFPIRYFRQENGGKHRAVNRGVALAQGEYFFIVDSDDSLTDDAVERVTAWTADIAGLDGFAGVSGLRASPEGASSGGTPKLGAGGFVDATNLERGQYRLGGEKAEVYKTRLLREYPFPEFEGETFITEAVVWDEIAAAGYKLRWFGQPLIIWE